MRGTAAAPMPSQVWSLRPTPSPSQPTRDANGGGSAASARATPPTRARVAQSSSFVRGSMGGDPPIRVERQHRVGVLLGADSEVLAKAELRQGAAVGARLERAQPALAVVMRQLERGMRTVVHLQAPQPALREQHLGEAARGERGPEPAPPRPPPA